MKDSQSENKKNSKVTTQLLKLLDSESMQIDLIAGIAGDRPLTEEEEGKIAVLHKRRGEKLYSDMIFCLSHQYYPSEHAKEIWKSILGHKEQLEYLLGRNVGVSVAALDYLSNIKKELDSSATFMSTKKIHSIAEIAIKDGLTELFDHSSFKAKLESEILRCKRYGNEVTLLMLDLDNFKEFNDTYGHQEGDALLARLGSIILDEIRDVDIGARYGGEEFSILLPQTTIEEGLEVAERIRTKVEETFRSQSVTVSIGLANCPRDSKSSRKLIKRADKALYQSKEDGKNKVTACSSS